MFRRLSWVPVLYLYNAVYRAVSFILHRYYCTSFCLSNLNLVRQTVPSHFASPQSSPSMQNTMHDTLCLVTMPRCSSEDGGMLVVPPLQQWPVGPPNEVYRAAGRGSPAAILHLLSSELFDVIVLTGVTVIYCCILLCVCVVFTLNCCTSPSDAAA